MSLYGIGLSGLNAGQIALSTAGNNITNVNTPGYNRQIADMANDYFGGGVKVTSIDRQFSAFVADQVNSSTSLEGFYSAYDSKISQLDTLLGDTESGLSVMMSNFFSALADLAAAPSDPAARQGLLGTADNLTSQFRSFDTYVKSLHQGVNSEVSSTVVQVNSLSSQVAKLNKEISLIRAKSDEEPNALLDQRDQLVSQINDLVEVKLSVQDGTYNLSFANGLPLVAGKQTFSLQAIPSGDNPQETTVGYVDGAGNLIQIQEGAIKGGSLGGILAFRDESLKPMENRLGQMALVLGTTFNDQHKAGVDLNGVPGNDFFSLGSPVSYTNAKNSGTGSVTASFDDVTQVTTNDYQITYNAVSGYSVKVDGSNEVVATFPVGTTTLTFGGLSVDVSGAPANGDRFLVRPLSQVTAGFESIITDVGEIAAGQAAGGTGTGDNRNVLALQQLQFAAKIEGNSTFNQAYASMVTDVGNRTSVVGVNLKTQAAITNDLVGLQQSESGVNLDEEAANLLRFQQYYQASAKVIEAASSVMDTILSIRN